MFRSLVCIALGLVATSSGQDNWGIRRPPTPTTPEFTGNIEDLFCQGVGCDSKTSTQQQGLPNPYPAVNPYPSINPYPDINSYADISSYPATTQGSPDKEDCQCVQYSLCRNSTTDEYGQDIIDLRSNYDGCSYLEKCCKAEDIRTPKPTQQARIDVRSCGKRNPNGVGFHITNDHDHEAQYGEFPWMVAVIGRRVDRNRNPDGGVISAYLCGGSLIHPQVVLTAAHCVNGKEKNLLVRVGEWDTQTKNEPHPTENIKVRKVIVHEQFEKRAALNDVALLILEKPVDMSKPSVGLICLPEAGEDMDGRHCVSSGWGKDDFEGKHQAILKKVDGLPMVPSSRCQEALRETRLGPRFILHESFVCAGGINDKDTCKGDGGGPLVCLKNNDSHEYVQAGIVAWGIGCKTETPAVYVNVAHFVNWIEDKLRAEDISDGSEM